MSETVAEIPSSVAPEAPPATSTEPTATSEFQAEATPALAPPPTESAAAPAPVTESAPAPAAPAPIVLHHLDNSRSQRIIWLLEELGVPYEIKFYKRKSDQLAPPELKKVHPLGKSPVITDGSITLAESGAIIEYLIGKYGNGRFTPTEAGYIDNLYYTHFPEATIQPWSLVSYIFQLLPGRTPLIVRPVASAISKTVRNGLAEPNIKDCLAMVEAHLAKSPSGWFAGGPEPTSADFLMIFPLEALQQRGTLGPKSKEFVQRVHAREAYKKSLEKGGTYAYA